MPYMCVAFSGGLDSTYLIHKLLKEKHDVHVIPCIIMPSGGLKGAVADLLAIDNILKYFNEFKDDYQGTLCPPVYYVRPSVPANTNVNTPNTHNINQQVNVAMGLMQIRKKIMDDCWPSLATGWLKQDCSEHTFNEADYSEEQYEALLTLPKTLGRVSGLDGVGTRIHTPIWNMNKKELWEGLPDRLKELLSFNGYSSVILDRKANEWIVNLNIDSGKRDEYKEFGIELPDSKTYSFHDLSLTSRYLTGYLRPHDLRLDSSYGIPESLIKLIQEDRYITDRVCYRNVLKSKDFDELIKDLRYEILKIHEIYNKDSFKNRLHFIMEPPSKRNSIKIEE